MKRLGGFFADRDGRITGQCGACVRIPHTGVARYTYTMPSACYSGGQLSRQEKPVNLFARLRQWLVSAVTAAQGQPAGGDGNYRFEIQAFDRAGNFSGLTTYNVTIDTRPPGVDEAVFIGLTTNRDTTRNYCLRKRSDPPNACSTANDGEITFSDDLFTNSNFPTFHINCPSCSSGGSVSLEQNFIKRSGQRVSCSRYFLSGCTASFNSANLRLLSGEDRNGTWQIDISFLKDSAGNSPPPGTWRTFEVLNQPPQIIVD